jgi:hypothetical protein
MPESLFCDKLSQVRLLQCPKSRLEKLPEKLLCERSKYLRDGGESATKVGGISPENGLYDRSKMDRLLQDEGVAPSFPVSLLSEKLRRFKFWQVERE